MTQEVEFDVTITERERALLIIILEADPKEDTFIEYIKPSKTVKNLINKLKKAPRV